MEGQMVVFFRSELRDGADRDKYRDENRRLSAMAAAMPGFVSAKVFTAADGDRVTIVTFESEDSLRAWRELPDHVAAQERGRDEYYRSYSTQICKVVRESWFEEEA